MSVELESPAGGRVLVVDDDPDLLAIVSRFLGGAGLTVETAGSAQEGLMAAAGHPPDAVLLDLGLPDSEGLQPLEEFRRRFPDLPVVILTADASVGSVVGAMQLGAWDYLPKPVDRTKLTTTLRNAVERSRLSSRVRELEGSNQGRHGIIGHSPAMVALFRRIDRVAPADITVAIQGPSGAGKELVARALHEASSRKNSPFVALNCAAIPESLQESELFGHEKGAFTGALGRRVGRFEEANKGTLFLDEIAELSPSLQAKLLRALQEKAFSRVGGSALVQSDFRLISATHKNLTQEVAAGRFREDLFYRVSVFELQIPPLKERPEDIPVLAAHFLSAYGATLRFSAGAMDVLTSYDWPGNVRELQNAIQHAAVIASGGLVDEEDLPGRIRVRAASVRPPSVLAPESVTPGSAVVPLAPRQTPEPTPVPVVPLDPVPTPRPSRDEIRPSPTERPESSSLPIVSLEELEKLAILQSLARNKGQIIRVVEELQIGRTTLYRKLKQYGIQADP